MPNWFLFSFNSFFCGSLRRPRWSNAQRKKLDKATSRPRSHWRCPLIYELNKMTTCPLAFRKYTASLVHEFRIWFRNYGRTPHIVLFVVECVQLRIRVRRRVRRNWSVTSIYNWRDWRRKLAGKFISESCPETEIKHVDNNLINYLFEVRICTYNTRNIIVNNHIVFFNSLKPL